MAQYKVFMHEFKFVKMNGLGNDFIVIDQRVSEFDLSEEQIKLICNRTVGVGCDQLIMIRKSQDNSCLLYTSPSPRDLKLSRMPSSA